MSYKSMKWIKSVLMGLFCFTPGVIDFIDAIDAIRNVGAIDVKMIMILGAIRIMMTVLHTVFNRLGFILLLLLRLLLELRLRHIGLIEKVKEEHEIRKVHNGRPFYVVIAHVTLDADTFLVKSNAIYVDTDYHLYDLASRDGHVHPFGYFEAHCAECVI